METAVLECCISIALCLCATIAYVNNANKYISYDSCTCPLFLMQLSLVYTYFMKLILYKLFKCM